METIVIEGKDYKCSNRVAEEISWLDSQLKAAKILADRVVDLQDEFDTSYREYQDKIGDLVEQIKGLGL